ncbi:alpha/beta hydrolase family protein DUF900 [Chitinophaga skermanii]|uniref:Alpha/beta hydrolase family protein DUF900 n=1 Tax=Chitinophaga skermanii TaxID=331697 RepID=A0A327R1B2_9BACT|nr:alpha/beta hydrolase [Chitinophaga skermanii]RAJ10421.1 alpha/beta hydrolase family protein DUF900 [Chitinophaga skermanii]
MRQFVVLCLCCFWLTHLAHAQQPPDYNSRAYWSKFQLQPENAKPKIISDTCMVFVSNRHFQPDSARFLDEFVDTLHLNYFFLQKQDTNWLVYRTPSLNDAMLLMPHQKDIVVYAEGMGKIFTSNVDRAYLLTSQYSVNVIMFDYSSINSTYKPKRNFAFAQENARMSAKQYLQLLHMLQEGRAQQASWLGHANITLFYHSMGNIILKNMMQTKGIELLNQQPFIDNLVINAACVPQKKHAKWVEKIDFAKHVIVHYNPRDIQLKGAHLLMRRRLLGENLFSHLANNATYVNFRPLANWKHTYFMNFPHEKFKLSPSMHGYFAKLFGGDSLAATEVINLFASGKTKTDL